MDELQSLKLYIELLQANCDYRDAESIIWYGKFIELINEQQLLFNQIENENERYANGTSSI